MLIYAHPLVKVIRAREFLQGVGKDPWFILIQSGEEQVPIRHWKRGECDRDGAMWQLLMGICNKFPLGIAKSNLHRCILLSCSDQPSWLQRGMEMLTLSWWWQTYHPSIPGFITGWECCPDSWFYMDTLTHERQLELQCLDIINNQLSEGTEMTPWL